MTSGGFLPPGLVNPVRFLKEELAPYPGRVNLALRVMLSSALILVISLTLEVPGVGVSLILALAIAQMNIVASRLIGVVAILAATLGCAVMILIYKFTYDYPLLRILTTVVLLYGSFYMMRAATLGPLVVIIVATIVVFGQTFVDQTDNAEILVRAMLWCWVFLCYPAVVGLVVNTLLLPLEPLVQLKAEFHRQLKAIDARLSCLLGDAGAPPAPIATADVQKGTLALQKLLKFTTMRDRRVKAEQARYLATIATVSRLYYTVSELPAEPSDAEPELADTLRQLRSACAELDAAIANDRSFVLVRLPEVSPSLRQHTGIEPVVEMKDALRALSQYEEHPSAAPAKGPGLPMLVPGAFINPVYNQFALKTTLAVMIGYVFYTGVDYGGIHTIMLTCIYLAVSSSGAVIRKAWLRFFGAGIGSLIALFDMVFVIPHIDGLVGVLMMVLPVMALSSYILAGSERIAYVGFQITVTYGLAFLMNFSPSTNLTEVRDRMIGIVLGIVVYTVVSTLLWPEREGKSARDALADLLKEIGRFLEPIRKPAASTAVAHQHLAVMTELGKSEEVLARVALEPRGRESEQEELTLTLQTILAQARSLAVAVNELHRQIEVHEKDLPTEVREGVESMQKQIIAALDTYAEGLRGDGCRSPEPIPLDELERSFPSSPDAASEDMKSAFLDATENVVRQLSSLPGWSASLPSPTEVELIPSYR